MLRVALEELPPRYRESDPFESRMAELLESSGTADILEVGAGRRPALSQRPSGRYVALDPDSVELGSAPWSSERVVQRVEDFIPGLVESFDLVISRNTFEHVSDLSAALGQHSPISATRWDPSGVFRRKIRDALNREPSDP
jgi:hypothetical protein